MKSSYRWENERLDLQRRINRIKVMLWATDYGAAQRELAEIARRYEFLIRESLELKKRLTSIYRDEKPKIERKYRQEGMQGRDLAHQAQEDIAPLLQVKNEREDSLYLISPIANIVRKLDTRVEEQINRKGLLRRRPSVITAEDADPIPPDHLTGYHFIVDAFGSQQWEVRAYRFDPPPMDTNILISTLQKGFDNKLRVVEVSPEKTAWPLWYRAFLPNAYIDLKFFDLERFELSVVGDRDYIIDEHLKAVLLAIAHSQQSHFESG